MTQTILYNLMHFYFLGTWGRGDSSYRYTYGDRTQYTTPIHSHFWRLGDSTQGYTYGDRDTIYHPYNSQFWRLWDVGTVRTHIHMEIGTQYTTPIHSHFWRRGDSTQGYTYGDRDTIYHPLCTLIFKDLGTWGQYPRIYIRR